MSLARSVARNTVTQIVGKIATVAIGVVTLGLLQRLLHTSGFGAYTIAMSYLGFASVVADFGLYVILARELNKPGADRPRLIANALGLRLTTFAIVFLLALAALPFFGYDAGAMIAILIGSLGFLGVAVTQLLVSVFQTELAMGRVVWGEVVGRLVLLTGVLALLVLKPSLPAVMVAVVISSLANAVVLLAAVRRYVPVRLAFDRPTWRYLLVETAPVAASVVLNLLYFRLDTIILSVLRPATEVGLYGAAYKVLEILNTLPLMFVGLMIPLLTQALADRERFRRLYQRSLDVLVMAVVPIVAGGWVLADSIVTLIGGPEFAAAAPILRLLLIAVAGLYLNALSGHAVTVVGKQRPMVWAYLAVATIAVTLYAVLIPRLGMRGAAYGTIISEWLTAMIGGVVVFRTMRFVPGLWTIAKACLAAAAMAAALWGVPGARLWLEIPLGIIVYGVLLLVLQAVPRQFLRELRAQPVQPTAPPTL